MVISVINNPNYVYFNLHAEEVISSNFLNDDNQGIYISSLQFETVNRVLAHIKSIKYKQSYLLIDFDKIEHIQPNILDTIVEIRNLSYKLIFLNVSEKIHSSLSLNTIDNKRNIYDEKFGYKVFHFYTDEHSDFYSIEIKTHLIFSEYFKSRLSNYIVKYEKPHASSFVYLRSFIDLKKFISVETPLIYFALYALAIKIKRKWESELINSPILVSQSLTSTYVVSILSKLLKLDILVFDKIGPITKLYNKLEKHNFEGRKYIIVSDLVCLGTEVKITKSLIEFSGGQYLGNVSLVKVETLTRDDFNLENIDRTIAVFSVNNKNNVALNYYIYTNLTRIDE